MVRRRGRGAELMWVISPATTKAIEQLQAKIKSKMETAKVLGACLTGLIRAHYQRDRPVADRP